MYGRPAFLFPLALLALLALLTFWIEHNVQAPLRKMDGSGRHDPDYILNNFATTKNDADGNLRYILAAAEMKHFPDDDSTTLVRPRYTQYAINKPYTQIEGQHGSVSSNGEMVEFVDNVKVVRQAFNGRGEMVVLTDQLTIKPKEDLAYTDKPVKITQAPETVVYATGMIYDKKNRTVKLLKKVRAHYVRPNSAKARSESKAANNQARSGQQSAKTKAMPQKKEATGKKVLGSSKKQAGQKKVESKNTANNPVSKSPSTQKNTRTRRKYEHPASQ